jgi:hypothetical protein
VTNNIFIDNSRDDKIYTDPVIGDLPDHTGKLTVIKNIE